METFLIILSVALWVIGGVAISGLLTLSAKNGEVKTKHSPLVVFLLWPFVVIYAGCQALRDALVNWLRGK